ncbi:hypothetical protein LSAT2_014952 [Lamellibrachia satsuma]|nr:hypothetical protein LSAT2_014952 [Lamellibrachia satsuma]
MQTIFIKRPARLCWICAICRWVRNLQRNEAQAQSADCADMSAKHSHMGYAGSRRVMDVASKSKDDNSTSCSKTRCYYVSGSTVPFDEDVTHEFKGHKNLSNEEIPPWTQIANSDRRTRGPVSRCLNGFLNNECGGTVYLGILDDGKVNGFSLTQYQVNNITENLSLKQLHSCLQMCFSLTQFQKDHVVSSLDDLMKRYRPPVEEHRYTVKFVPIVDEDCSEEDIARIVSYDSSKNVSRKRRETAHTLREYKRCWCDQDRIEQFKGGILAARYIIEITIKPWDREDPRNKYAVGKMKAIPIHEDETGCVSFRKHATVISHYNMQQLCEISKAAVRNHYEPKINRLRQELHQLRQSLYNKDSNDDAIQPSDPSEQTLPDT